MSEKFVIEITRGSVGTLPQDLKGEITLALAKRFSDHRVFVRKLSSTEEAIAGVMDSLKDEIRAEIEEKIGYHEYHHDHQRNDRY